MIENIVPVLTVSAFTLVGWVVALLIFLRIKNIPRIRFITVRYLLNIIIFGIIFYIYFRFIGNFPPLTTMFISVISIFIFEVIYWRNTYSGTIWFLNFKDWVFPTALIAGTIYLIGVLHDNGAIDRIIGG